MIVHPSTSTPATVEYCHNPETVTVLELDAEELCITPSQYAPAGHSLQDAWPAVSWYCPAGHVMHAAVAAPPLL